MLERIEQLVLALEVTRPGAEGGAGRGAEHPGRPQPVDAELAGERAGPAVEVIRIGTELGHVAEDQPARRGAGGEHLEPRA